MTTGKKDSEINGLKFDASNINDTKLLKSLTGFFAKIHSENYARALRIYEDLIDGLPNKVKTVQMIENKSVATWQNHLSGSTIKISMNPEFLAGRNNPGRTLHHELAHKSEKINKWSASKSKEYVKEHQAYFQKVSQKSGSKKRARSSINYGLEERYIYQLDNQFALEFDEQMYQIPNFERAVDFYIVANKWG